MSLRKTPSFKKYRETCDCDECGRPYDYRSALSWWHELRRSDKAHNEWHKTATPDELEKHQADVDFSNQLLAATMAMFTRSVNEKWETDVAALTHDFKGLA